MQINELGTMRARGFGLTAHCMGCLHYGPLDLERLIARFGPEFNSVDGHEHILAVSRCARCGGKALELRLRAPSGFDGGGGHR
jgi:hypothetical protein